MAGAAGRSAVPLAGATHQPTAAGALAPLREELLLHAAPRAHDGAPAWTLEDPGRNLFFQIGWAEAEMLARWSLGTPQRIAAAMNAQTTLAVDAAEVAALARFLDAQGLLQLRGAAACERYVREARARRRSGWFSWIIHHYLFFRIPLLRPDAFLDRTVASVAHFFFTRGCARMTALAGAVGLFLAARQWDTFVHTFLHFFTLEGAAIAAIALAGTKMLHEFGHAYAAKYCGCRVATMGVAFIVMCPVLYTDASGAWRLSSRRQRLAIGAAGMLTETAIAAWATLSWSFLPDGMLRSAAFTLATTTWLLTLAVNLNPLMRFDGYFLLTDLLNVPNLQQRAFALARWRLREWLFGFGDPRPEAFAPWRERALVAYALCVWIYRFFLFLGIALLVYHFAFKLLGILLFSVEIVFFLMRPVVSELATWLVRLGAGGGRWNRHSRCTAAGALVLLLLAAIPWQTRVTAPALAHAAEQARLVAPVGARLDRILVRPGQYVAAGTPLYVLWSPGLAHELQALQRRIEVLVWQLDFHAVRQDTAADVPAAQHELQVARERLAVLERQKKQLVIAAPFSGVLVDQAEPLATGEWVGAGEWLGTLANPRQRLVEAYVAEADLARVAVGDRGKFIPEDLGRGDWKMRVAAVARTATRSLASVAELASPNGGAIAATPAPAGRAAGADGAAADVRDWVPEKAVYRVQLVAQDETREAAAIHQTLRGTVLIDGAAASPLLRVWRRAAAVVVREAGF